MLGDTGRYREMLGDTGGYREIQGDTGRCWEIQGDTGRCMEVQGDTGRYREMQGDTGRYREIQGDAGRCREMQGDTAQRVLEDAFVAEARGMRRVRQQLGRARLRLGLGRANPNPKPLTPNPNQACGVYGSSFAARACRISRPHLAHTSPRSRLCLPVSPYVSPRAPAASLARGAGHSR